MALYTFDAGVPSEFGPATTAGWTVEDFADAATGTLKVLRSKAISHGGDTSFEVTLTFDGDTSPNFRIRYWLESEAHVPDHKGGDNFRVYVDGARVLSDSGLKGWSDFSQFITPGSHKIMFRYQKDSSTSTGLDAVRIGFVQTGRTPFRLAHLASEVALRPAPERRLSQLAAEVLRVGGGASPTLSHLTAEVLRIGDAQSPGSSDASGNFFLLF